MIYVGIDKHRPLNICVSGHYKRQRQILSEWSVGGEEDVQYFSRDAEILQHIFDVLGGNAFSVDHRLAPLLQPKRHQSALRVPSNIPDLLCKTPQWAHQKIATFLALEYRRLLMAMDMGTGKTKVVCDISLNAKTTMNLFVAPKAVVPNWITEIGLHGEGRVLCVDTSKPVSYRAKQVEEFLKVSSLVPTWVVVDHASVIKPEMANLLLSHSWDMIGIDEAHKICNSENKLSQFMYRLRDTNPDAYRIAMTGTPHKQRPLEIYGIAYFIDPDAVGDNRWIFEHRHGVFSKKLITTRARDIEIEEFVRLVDADAFARLCARFMYRVEKGEVLDLPPAIHVRRYASMPSTVRSALLTLKKEQGVEIDGEFYKSEAGAEYVLRQQQVTGKCKGEALAETLSELSGEPIVIFARFTEDIRIIRETVEKAGLKCLEQSGKRSEWQRFQNGEGDVLVVQIQSGGAGINLTRAAYVVYYSVGRSVVDYTQSQSRSHRPGQKRSVTYIHLIVENSIDEVCYEALQSNQDILDYLSKQTKNAIAA